MSGEIDGSEDREPQDFWQPLRESTQSRIGLGRAGSGLPTRRLLEFNAAHASARDAVLAPLDVDALALAIGEADLGVASNVTSRAAERGEYLRRPDLGRLPATLPAALRSKADVGIVLADGLSPRAVQRHGVPMMVALRQALSAYTVAAPVIATQARVGLGDHIAVSMGIETVIVLIGERPGLSVADSLGIYLTHRPRIGCADSERNCVSNIHPPEGLGYEQAAGIVANLVAGARALGRSGVSLKDTSRGDAVGESVRDAL